MSERRYYVICEDNCKFESMTKEQILEAIEDAIEQGYVSEPDNAVFSRIKEIRANNTSRLWIGTEAQFNGISPAPAYSTIVLRLSNDGIVYLVKDDDFVTKTNSDIDYLSTTVDISSFLTITKGTNCGEASVYAAYKCGRIAHVVLRLVPSGSVAAGGNVGATISANAEYLPITSVRGPAYVGAKMITGAFETDGTVNARTHDALTASNIFFLQFTYITAE